VVEFLIAGFNAEFELSHSMLAIFVEKTLVNNLLSPRANGNLNTQLAIIELISTWLAWDTADNSKVTTFYNSLQQLS
jgi:hypothetical protein